MIRVPASLLLILLLAAGGLKPASRPMLSVTAITHVTIIDATGSPPQPDMTVLIEEDRIREIGKAEELAPPVDAEMIDATGKFLIPGLWDMHVHALHADHVERVFSEFVAQGVLGIRDMGGATRFLLMTRDAEGSPPLGRKCASPLISSRTRDHSVEI
jgi:imidazolonepropionase-like amidohydrolase